MGLEKIDPFHYFDRIWEKYVGVGGPIKVVADIVFAILFATIVYSILSILFNTPRPIVIVASDSMIPVFYPGDIVFVRGIYEINAPTIELNVSLNYRVTPSQIGLKFKREGLTLVGMEINGKFIPLDKNGTIVVYYDDLKGRDIIHRVILKIKTPHGNLYVTKGDNDTTNPTADQDCVLGRCVYPFLVDEKQILGTPFFTIPRIGIIKIILFGS